MTKSTFYWHLTICNSLIAFAMLKTLLEYWVNVRIVFSFPTMGMGLLQVLGISKRITQAY